MSNDPPRLGFCCKFLPDEPGTDRAAVRAAKDLLKTMNLTTVTMAHLTRLGPNAAPDKLAAVVTHNLAALMRQVEWVAARPPVERLMRIASSVLPGYTHPLVRPLYAEPSLRDAVETGLAAIGERARAGGVRLGFHPGPFCILGTASEAALTNAVDELDYHAELMGLMGYAGWHSHGAHVNIHVGARAGGTEAFRVNLPKASQAARDLVTVENDETSFGFDEVLQLADVVPVVLDLHHHWVASAGQYVEPDDPRIARVIESWRGARPMSHVSAPREVYAADPDRLPDFAALVAAGAKPRDLMAHSDMMWNRALNDLVARHLGWSDFEIEAKAKNLASTDLAASLAARGGLAQAA